MVTQPIPTGRTGYKDAPPEATVARIRDILDRMGIQVKETLYAHGDVAYSCRITIANPGLETLDTGTNGKGLTPAYALASGYAEFMERLQNKFLINEALRFAPRLADVEPLPFRFFPDEEVQDTDIDSLFDHVFSLFMPASCSDRKASMARFKERWGDARIRYRTLPYSRLSSQKGDWRIYGGDRKGVVPMPIVALRANGSTGMCAGNTPAEAILQGVCEIFERYVLQQIYLRPVTPPDFPLELLEGSIALQRLKALEEEGYSYRVKDMSLGMKLPVIGLILTDTRRGTTMVRLGSDPDAGIALERCISEIFQGDGNAIARAFIDYNATPPLTGRDDDFGPFRREYLRSLRDGTGRYPAELFAYTPAYAPSPWHSSRCKNSLETLRRIILHVIDLNGYELFVRDNSFLGFGTYHAYIPGLSEHDRRLMQPVDDYLDSLRPDADGVLSEDACDVWPLYDIKSASDTPDKAIALMHFIERRYCRDSELSLAPWNLSPRNRVNKNLLLFMLAMRGNDRNEARRHLTALIDERRAAGLTDNSYLECWCGLLRHDTPVKPDSDAYRQLCGAFTPEVADEVIADAAGGDIMRNYSFPTCFDCVACPLRAECRFRDVIELERRIQLAQLGNPLNQAQLFTLVDDKQPLKL